MMKIAICDDDKYLLPLLSKNIMSCFTHYKTDVTADTFERGLTLRRSINSGNYYDVIFLDIDLKDCDGIDLGMYLKQIQPSASLIFVSNMDNYVFRSFAARPLRFVRKSHFNEEMPEAVRTAIETSHSPEKDTITIPCGSRIVQLNPHRIIYAESRNNNVIIYTETEPLTLRYTLSNLEKLLEGYGFIRTHKSFLVNHQFIFRMEKNAVIMDNQSVVPISRSCMKQVKESLRHLCS